MVDVVNDVIINYKSVGLDKVGQEIRDTSVSLDGLVVSATGADKATASIENRFKSLERTLGTSSATQRDYEAKQNTINVALAQNPTLASRAAEATAALDAKYLSAGRATAELAEAHKGLDTQGQAAFHSIRSMTEQLVMGIPPTQALAGQINHLTYAASGEGGLAGAFKQVGGFVSGLIAPTTAAIAATVALGAAAAAAAIQYDKLQVSSQRAISGAGARTGTTTSDINSFVGKNTPSALSGSSLSQNESRALAEGLTQTGDVVISKLQSMSAAVVGFSNQTGKSVDESVKTFSKLGSDPVKALDELAQAFGPFSQKTRDLVEDAVVAGDKTKAWNVILNDLGATAKGTAGNLTTAEVAGRGFVNVLQSAIKPTGLEKQLADITQQLNGAIEAANQFAEHGVEAPPEVSNTIMALNKQFETLYARQQAVIDQRAGSAFNDLADKARNATEALGLGNQKINEAITVLNQLKAARDAGVQNLDTTIAAQTQYVQLLQNSQAATVANVQQVALLRDTWGSVNAAVNVTLASLQDQINLAKAVTDSEKEAAQFRADYNKLINEGNKSDEDARKIASKMKELRDAQADSQEKITNSSAESSSNIGSGADASQRAAAAALQWQQNMLGVGDAAKSSMASINAAMDAEEAAQRAANPTAGTFTSDGSFNGSGKQSSGSAYSGVGYALYLADKSIPNTADVIKNSIFSGVDSALSTLKGSNYYDLNTVGAGASVGVNPGGFPTHGSQSDYDSAVSQLYDLKVLQAGDDKNAKLGIYNDELSYLQTKPKTLSTLTAIENLKQSINQLKNATDANTAASLATLNPLYTQGHGALAIGYYHAASGLDATVQGPGGVDSVPVHIMMTPGETLKARPPGQSNDNDQKSSTIQNVYMDMRGMDTNTARRNRRQFAQGFGQVAAAMR